MLKLRETEHRYGYKKTIQGGGHKTGIKIYIYHPINLHGGEIQFVNLLLFGIEPSEDNLITTVFPEYLP
jgi:hypothetical protein